MTISFGATLPQFTSDRDRFMQGVEAARAAGLDSLWVFDHIWPLGEPRRPILECWSTLAWLAAQTDVHVGTLVTRSSLRHPVLLGKMAATVGEIAPGRLTVALGSGDNRNRDENRSIGAPYFAGGRRVAQLVSTVEVVQHYLKAPRVDLQDGFVSVDSLVPSPRPLPPPQLWVGGRSDEILEVAGRIADGWNGWGTDLAGFAEDATKVKTIAGERPFTISWAGQVVLGDGEADARRRLGDRDPAEHLVGSPAKVAARLQPALEAGATHLVASVPSVRAEDYDGLGQLGNLLRR